MRWFARPARPGPILRTRLRLESLDDRAAPASLLGADPEPTLLTQPLMTEASASAAPVIVSFGAREFGPGYYYFYGQVQFAGGSAGGLTVTLGGIPSLEGRTATTATDGSFWVFVTLRTDGSDSGTAEAQTVANGQLSNLAMCNVSPTPAP